VAGRVVKTAIVVRPLSAVRPAWKRWTLHRQALGVLPVERYAERDSISHVSEARRYLATRDPDDVALAALAPKLGIAEWLVRRGRERVPAPGVYRRCLLRNNARLPRATPA
jgi:hypothetical protein